MSYEADAARLQAAYLRDALARAQRRDQQLAEREAHKFARHSRPEPVQRPKSSGQVTADLLVDGFQRRQDELRKQRDAEHRAAVRRGKAEAKAANDAAFDQRTSAEKLLGLTAHEAPA